MGTTEWILALLLGGILGMIGQGIRMVMGLKKANDEASAKGERLRSELDGSRLMLSLLIGFIAGALAVIGLTGSTKLASLDKELIVTIIGAGYAGTDFIEGFINKSASAVMKQAPVATAADATQPPAAG